jgi:hypothetical protein
MLTSVIEQQIIVIMLHSWLIKILSCFSHTKHRRRKQPSQQSTYDSIIKNEGKNRAVSCSSSISHTFSTPLNVSMLRKVRCRIQSSTLDKNPVRLPLLITSLNQQPIAGFLNESQNCAEISPYEYTFSINRSKRNSSLIAIHIDDDEYSQEQALIEHRKQSKHSRSLIRLADNDSSLTISSYCSRPHKCSVQSVRKQTSDSIIFIHRHRPTKSDYSTNSITYDSPMSDTTSSTSDVLTSLNRTKDKTWRLQIHDDLNKDGSRHNVMHKGLSNH